MTASYSKASAYFKTNTFGSGKFLDLLYLPTITKQVDDVSYVIDKIYEFRPDLLAYDLYSDSALWWVFRARNPNALDDPIFDFRAGVVIMIPKKTTLVDNLGL